MKLDNLSIYVILNFVEWPKTNIQGFSHYTTTRTRDPRKSPPTRLRTPGEGGLKRAAPTAPDLRAWVAANGADPATRKAHAEAQALPVALLDGTHAREVASLRASRRRPMSVRQNLPSYRILPYAS